MCDCYLALKNFCHTMVIAGMAHRIVVMAEIAHCFEPHRVRNPQVAPRTLVRDLIGNSAKLPPKYPSLRFGTGVQDRIWNDSGYNNKYLYYDMYNYKERSVLWTQ